LGFCVPISGLGIVPNRFFFRQLNNLLLVVLAGVAKATGFDQAP
jgi:hypothetical protein